MGSGFEVYNDDESLQFDSSTYALARRIFTFSIGTANGSQALPAGLSGAQALPLVTVAAAGKATPAITVSNGTVSWDFGSIPSQYRSSCTILVATY